MFGYVAAFAKACYFGLFFFVSFDADLFPQCNDATALIKFPIISLSYDKVASFRICNYIL